MNISNDLCISLSVKNNNGATNTHMGYLIQSYYFNQSVEKVNQFYVLTNLLTLISNYNLIYHHLKTRSNCGIRRC